jgi:glycosyltransferase involved in cell wall biosynthesis
MQQSINNHSNATHRLSIVMPCYNEADNLALVLKEIIELHPDAELVVVDDASTDDSADIAEGLGARVIRHPCNMGNGASVKTGARHASGDILVFMDADGQHKPEDISRLLHKLHEGYDMVVGARVHSTHASFGRRLANSFYNRLASLMTGFDIEDLTSGFRAVRADKFRRFLYLLPNGFSYPTTSTMAFFRSAFPVAYVTIKAAKRKGKSKIRHMRDGTRFFIIILKVGALFSPMRFFLPISAFFFCTGLFYYAYTFIDQNRFTNMSALLFITAIMTFLIGIVSEQISSLHYRHSEENTNTKE